MRLRSWRGVALAPGVIVLTLGGWAVWLEPRQRFAAGHIVEGGHHLYVATGVGTSILPVRFLVPPAVTILTLGGDARPAH